MGLYKQPKSKNWYMELTDEHGSRVRKSTRTADHSAASIVYARELESIEKRKLGLAAPSPIASRQPIELVIEGYLDSMREDGLSGDWVKTHRWFLLRMKRTLGWETIRDIDRDQLRRFVSEDLAELKRKSKTEYVNAARLLCDWAVAQSPPLLASNPVVGVLPRLRGKKARMAREHELLRRPLTRIELGRFLGAAPTDARSAWRWYRERLPIYTLAACTGYRRSTLRGLRTRDVRLDGVNPHIAVPPSMTKSGRAIRTPINDPKLAQIIRDRCALALARKESDRFYDRPFAPVPQITTFHKDIERAGIDRYDEHGLQVVFHSLRATYNVQLALAGVPIVIAAQLMDHTSIETTRKYYSYVGVSDTAAIMQHLPGIDEMMGRITLSGMAKSMA
jgi:integrase